MPERQFGEPIDAYGQRVHQWERSQEVTREIPIQLPGITIGSYDVTHNGYEPITNEHILETTTLPNLKKLALATKTILRSIVRARQTPSREEMDRRERDYVEMIESERQRNKTARELLYSDRPVYLPYIDYAMLPELSNLTSNICKSTTPISSGYRFFSNKTKQEIPIDHAFMLMGGIYVSTEVPQIETCAQCSFVTGDCVLTKMYDGREVYICPQCIKLKVKCNRCNNKLTLDYYEAKMCASCIERVSEDRPFRNYYLGQKWVGDKVGDIMQSMRVFSFEVEAILSSSNINLLGKTLPPEAGLGGDASIRGEGSPGVEAQSSLLRGSRGEEFTARTMAAFKIAKAWVNKSCGMHVHLSADEFIPTSRQDTPTFLKDLWKAHLVFEDVIFSFLPYNRRLNRYCRPLRDYFKISEIDMIETIYDAEKLWYKQQDANAIRSEKQHHHHASRYFGINFHSLFAQNHLEIRHHSGTLNGKKILQWANLHALIMDAAVAGKFTHSLLMDAQVTTSIKDKTQMLFEAIGLSNKSKQYFTQRQMKFSDKGQDEDGLTPMVEAQVERTFETLAPSRLPRYFSANWDTEIISNDTDNF